MVDISGLTMVYGRYNELVHGDYFMVYKPTHNWGGPSCMKNVVFSIVLLVCWRDLPDLSSSVESFGVHPIQRQPQLVVLVLGFTDHSKNEDRNCHKPTTNLAGCCS